MNDKDKVIELQQKLLEQDKETDKLRAEVSDLKAKEKTAWWKSPIGVAVAALLTAFAGKAEDLWSRVQQKTTESKVHGAAYELLIERQDRVEDTCMLYADAFMEAMPDYQLRRVHAFLKDAGVPSDATGSAGGARSTGSISRRGAIDSPPRELPEETTTVPPPASIKSSNKVNIYDMLQQKVQSKEDPNLTDLEEIIDKKRSRSSK